MAVDKRSVSRPADTTPGPERKRAVGRPRSKGHSATGVSTEEDILLAAATLFYEAGFGSTSTYAIARAAGVSQAGMYHYFGNKHAILLDLLLRTVRPSVKFSGRLLERAEPADVRLWALCAYDARLLAADPLNGGALYLLPELGDARFAEFHTERAKLAGVYATLIEAVARHSEVEADANLVFGLVESVILRRRTATDPPLPDVDAVVERIADAALRILGVPEARIIAVRDTARALIFR
ncbi:MAG: TetR/AcrR family transcriptional regulator [Actinomycetota bacterium]|nr:TetR/AcrR family transcriptional regulator [Actinomycetota bacterium]